jgi:hypothetical protein
MSMDDHDVEPGPARYRSYLEGALTGLAYAGALAAVGAFLVGSFRPGNLGDPYWIRIGRLRTDTFGFTCFFLAALAFAWSEFLRLTRVTRTRSASPPPAGAVALLVLAAARSLAVAGSILVAYLSVNAVTHPETLGLSATHLLSWPTESTLRVVALVLTACGVAVARALRITTGASGRA